MKTAVLLLLSFAMMAAVTQARPAESDIQSHDEHSPMIIEDAPQNDMGEEMPVLERERRSPQPKDDKSRGSITGGVHREKGVGTIVQAQGQGNIWTSKNGNGRLDAQGEWSKVVRGPARGKPNYNVGITYSHRF